MGAIRRRVVAGVMVVCAALLPSGALAQQVSPVPPIEEGPQLVASRMVGSQLELRDAQSNRAILATHNLPLWASFPVGVTVMATMQAQPTGADVSFLVKNVSSTSKKLGKFHVGIFNLGQDIEYRKFRMTSEPVRTNALTHIGQSWIYPLDLYSPVQVLGNDEYSVGVSMQYPVMQYKHDVRVHIGSPGSWLARGEAGRGWVVEFHMTNFGGETEFSRMPAPGTIEPGEERTYVMSIRVTKNVDEWVSTLLPYRNYFRAMYGGVQYQRETGPILGTGITDWTYHANDNDYGYGYQRPDLNGFRPFIDHVERKWATWDTIMLWTPTGFYRQNFHLNFPYQFASEWEKTERLRTAFSNEEGFPGMVARGKRLGLWWGRSTELSLRWDAPDVYSFDPDNQVHRAAAFKEMDAAVRAGATMIGLDTFTTNHTPLWKMIPWLKELMQKYPNVRFVTEPSQCDIVHTYVPNWITGWNEEIGRRPTRADYYSVTGPDRLADFLLPGHETWIGLRYGEMSKYERAPTEAEIEADMRKYADWGYRPVMFVEREKPAGIQAARSWEVTVPQAIRDSDPMIRNLRAGRLPMQNAPAAIMPEPQGPGAPAAVGGGDNAEGAQGARSGPRMGATVKQRPSRSVIRVNRFGRTAEAVQQQQPAAATNAKEKK